MKWDSAFGHRLVEKLTNSKVLAPTRPEQLNLHPDELISILKMFQFITLLNFFHSFHNLIVRCWWISQPRFVQPELLQSLLPSIHPCFGLSLWMFKTVLRDFYDTSWLQSEIWLCLLISISEDMYECQNFKLHSSVEIMVSNQCLLEKPVLYSWVCLP